MSYTVDWSPTAEQDLADIWVNATDQRAVTAAADYLDAELQRDPLALGESRRGVRRIAFAPPLAIAFDVYQGQGRVIVRSVWRIRPLSP